MTVETDKRARMAPIPKNYQALLTPMQLMALRNIENFGWGLYFVRRSGLAQPIPVVKDGTGQTIGVIDEDGRLDMNSGIPIRD